MFNKQPLVEFIALKPELLDILEKPYNSTKIRPDWFLKSERYIHGEKSIDRNNDPESTIKKCMPVVDGMSAGYHIPLYTDVWVDNKGEKSLSFRWALDDVEAVSFQTPEQHKEYPPLPGHYPSVFKWVNQWIVKTPPGYSCLFLHPMHHDLPFTCLPAIVDTDKYPAPVNFPFFLKQGFYGLLEKGTPMIQVIPFKREEFKASYSADKKGVFKKTWDKAHTVFFERYQRFFRSSKKYGEVLKKEKKCPFGF
jgi:hypothetical protein